MGNYKPLILILIIALVWFQPCLAQELSKRGSYQSLKPLSDQLSAKIQGQENNYQMRGQRIIEGSESQTCITQGYESNEYSVLVRIFIYENNKNAIDGFKQLFYGSNAPVGMRLAEIGDKAHGWFNGTIYVRKGNILVLIYVNPQESKDEQVQMNKKQSEQPKDINQPTSKEPVNRNPNSSTRLEIAKRFARHIVGFFEEQSS